jgi:hypothetical protein
MRRLFLVFLVLAISVPAFAQSMPQVKYTWIRYFTVEKGREADFMRSVREFDKPMFERLIANKSAGDWGLAIPLSMDAEPWTHAIWVGVPNWAGVESLVRDIETSNATMSPERQKLMAQLDTAVRPGSIRDVVLRHVVQSETMPAAAPKYIQVDTYVIKPGRHADAVALFREWAVPMFAMDSVKAKVGPWGLSVQDFPTSAPWTHMVWTFMSDLSARDVMDAASEGLDPRKLQGFDVRLRDMSEMEKQRSQILRIVTP